MKIIKEFTSRINWKVAGIIYVILAIMSMGDWKKWIIVSLCWCGLLILSYIHVKYIFEPQLKYEKKEKEKKKAQAEELENARQKEDEQQIKDFLNEYRERHFEDLSNDNNPDRWTFLDYDNKSELVDILKKFRSLNFKSKKYK